MNRYGKQMRDHYARHRSADLAVISDPEAYFATLGEQIETEIDELADQIAGDPDPSETYPARLGRLTEARLTAESEVLRTHMTPGANSAEPSS